MDFELKKWSMNDAKDVAKYANNKKIANNLRNVFPYPYTLEDAKFYVKSCVENDEIRQICRAIIVNGEAVGSIGIFLGNDVYSKNGELGYWLGEEFWRQGIMSAAVKQLCKEAFEKYEIVRIYAEPFAQNMGSRKTLEKAGFKLEGIFKNGAFKNGTVIDTCMYSFCK